MRSCAHFEAVQVGVICGVQLRGGHWLYEVPYHCPACGRRFTEMHRQTLATRIDHALTEVGEAGEERTPALPRRGGC